MKQEEKIQSNRLKNKITVLRKKTKKISTKGLFILILLLTVVFMSMKKTDFVFGKAVDDGYESLKDNHTKITFTGDVSPSRYLKEKGEEHGPDVFYEEVKSIWQDSDLSLINLETSILTGNPEDERYKKVEKPSAVYLDSTPEDVKAIKDSGIDLIGYANNHSMDYGVRGLEESLAVFEEEGIDYLGVGPNLEEAVKPYSEEINGQEIGIMAVSDIYTKDGLAKNNRSGMNMTSYRYSDYEVEKMVADHDFNIVYIHWGTEYALKPDKEIEELGKELIDLGVDLVVGAHPHVLLPVEHYQDGAIVYSLGNLVFDQNIGRTDESAIANLYLGEGEEYLEFIPLAIQEGIPYPTENEKITKRIFEQLTKELDEKSFEIIDNKLIVNLKDN